jgi:hypothetical protein
LAHRWNLRQTSLGKSLDAAAFLAATIVGTLRQWSLARRWPTANAR